MFNLDLGTPIGEFTDQALDAGERAVTLDEQDHWGHLVLGLGHARRRRPETAVMHLSQAVELNPNFALGYAGLGYAFACGGISSPLPPLLPGLVLSSLLRLRYADLLQQ